MVQAAIHKGYDMSMRMVDIIEAKRDGHPLSEEQIRFFVSGYVNGEIPDYQASAFAMAVLFRGMNEREIAVLTDAMMHSGEVFDLSSIPGTKVDKHSTGGVGDKTSLVLGPIVASCGAKLAKMSGRGLGHTGGTLDKMESVPGMRIDLSREEFEEQVKRIGIAITGQTSNIVPADKKLYALRDVTGTVESIPLIASSIMSKKLASGSDTILLDVKFGAGAFMKTFDDAKLLAETMVKIGRNLGRDTRAILTGMEQPLGLAVGNSLEVKEAIETLRGNGPSDFHELCISAASIMLTQAKIASSLEEGRAIAEEAIASGKAFEKLCELFAAQGGNVDYLRNPDLFPVSKHILPIVSRATGYVNHIDSLEIGLSAMRLGAGRSKLTDVIDHSAGIVLNKKVGSFVKEGEVLATAYTNKDGVDEVLKDIANAFSISPEKPEMTPIVAYYYHEV